MTITTSAASFLFVGNGNIKKLRGFPISFIVMDGLRVAPFYIKKDIPKTLFQKFESSLFDLR
jgi:hypothetical protein